MKDALDFISFVPWTFIAMIINVYIMYRILKRFLFKPVKEIFAKRQAELDNIYDEASKAKAEAENTKLLYEEQLKNADKKADEIIFAAEEAAKARQGEIISSANDKTRKRYEKAEQDIEQLHRKAATQLREDISQMAVDIAEKVVSHEISRESHERLIEESISRFGEEEV